MGWIPNAPVPPSEAKDGEAYKLRFLDKGQPDRPFQTGYGNLYVLGLLASIAIVFVGGAAYLGLVAQSNVHVSVSDVTAELGPCVTYPSVVGGTQSVNYSFLLTNSGSRDAVTILDLYGNGEWLSSTGAFTVPAGQTVLGHATAVRYACGPLTPTVAIQQVSPVG